MPFYFINLLSTSLLYISILLSLARNVESLVTNQGQRREVNVKTLRWERSRAPTRRGWAWQAALLRRGALGGDDHSTWLLRRRVMTSRK